MPKAYLQIEDFKGGLDSRRLEVSAAPGSLQVFENGHINRGGEIEIAKKWVPKYILPTGTFGLIAASNSLYVFGSGGEPGGIPTGVTYLDLQSPDSNNLVRVIMSEVFKAKPYVIAEFDDSNVYHFYNGEIVEDWYAGLVRNSQVNLTGVAAALAADASSDPIATVGSAGAVIKITGIADNDTFDVTASAVNGGSVDDQTAIVVETQAAGASQPQINTVTLGGTFDPGDEFTFTIDDNVYGASPVTGEQAAVILTHKNKMYAGAGTNVLFSVVANAALWRDNTIGSEINTGSGVIDMAAQSANDEPITGLGVYQGNVAIFSRNSTQVWAMDANPGANVQLQILDNTGTRSPKTIRSFGDLDLFYLSDSGYRSMRARDSSNAASVTDVGTPVDDIVLAQMLTLNDEQIKRATGIIEPRDGRYMSALDDTEYVFSFFSTSKISAWSTYKPGFVISDYTTLNGRVYARSGDVIYLLGGDDNDQYTEQEVVIEMPYLDARTIGHWKRWSGLDIILKGTWDVFVNTNPNQPDEWVKTATLYKPSVGQMNLAMQQFSPVLKMRFVHQGNEYACLSKIVVHYETAWAG